MFYIGFITGVLATLVAAAFASDVYSFWTYKLWIPIQARVCAFIEIMRADRQLLEAIVNRKEDPYKDWIFELAKWRLK